MTVEIRTCAVCNGGGWRSWATFEGQFFCNRCQGAGVVLFVNRIPCGTPAGVRGLLYTTKDAQYAK